MRSEKITCDRCHKEIIAPRHGVTVTLLVDKEPCPSGNGYTYNREPKDICELCVQVIVQTAYDQNILLSNLSDNLTAF